jgi:high-affinity iron transporter
MSAQIGNVVFIVWRESVEALLVIGILSAWLAEQVDPATRTAGRRFLWSGVIAGIVGACLLAWILTAFDEVLPEEGRQVFQTGMVLLAAALIVQMVLWMRRNGRTLKRDMETALSGAASRRSWWAVFVLALLAVLREGSETVIFLYGSLVGRPLADLGGPLFAAILGFAAAAVTYGLLRLGGRVLSWRLFFRVTEVMLLCLAAALLVTGVDGLIDLGWIPEGPRLWDVSAILPDSGVFGGLFSALTGWRARPSGAEALVFLAYWAIMAWTLLRPTTPTRTPHATA